MRSSEVAKEPKAIPDGMAKAKALAKTDRFFKLSIEVLAAGRDLIKKRDAGEPMPMSEQEYETLLMEVIRRTAASHGLEPMDVYLTVHEAEWAQYRRQMIDKDISEIGAMIDQGDHETAAARIKLGRTTYKSKVYNKLSSRLKAATV